MPAATYNVTIGFEKGIAAGQVQFSAGPTASGPWITFATRRGSATVYDPRPVDAGGSACYQQQVLRRVLSAILLCAVVAAHATAPADSAPTMRGGTTAQAGSSHLALCPTTRAGLQIGRQAVGPTGVPLAALPGLLPTAKDALAPNGWVRLLLVSPHPAKPGHFAPSARLTRGPPGRDS
jgi:hypothetical protein